MLCFVKREAPRKNKFSLTLSYSWYLVCPEELQICIRNPLSSWRHALEVRQVATESVFFEDSLSGRSSNTDNAPWSEECSAQICSHVQHTFRKRIAICSCARSTICLWDPSTSAMGVLRVCLFSWPDCIELTSWFCSCRSRCVSDRSCLWISIGTYVIWTVW